MNYIVNATRWHYGAILLIINLVLVPQYICYCRGIYSICRYVMHSKNLFKYGLVLMHIELIKEKVTFINKSNF